MKRISLTLPMDPTVIIKVQYGETLRRFSSRVIDGKLDLDINALRGKVLSLFSFPAGSELAFTYIDEDGDVVTLADEGDLRDIISQSLNPLRITVKLNMQRSARSHSRSSGNSTPVRSPRVQPPLQVRSTSVSEVLNSLPVTVRESVSRLSTELGFDANSPPGYNDLLDSFAKIGLTFLKEVSVSGAKSGPSESSTDALVTKDINRSLAGGPTQVSKMKSSDTDKGNDAGFSEGFVMPATDNANAKDKPSTLLENTAPDSLNATGGGKQDMDKFREYCWTKNSDTGSSEGNKVGGNKQDKDKFCEYCWTKNSDTCSSEGNKVGGNKQDKDKKFREYHWTKNSDTGSSEGNKVGMNGRFDHMMMDVKKSNESGRFDHMMMDVKKSNESRPGWNKPLSGIVSPFSFLPSLGHSSQHPHRVVPFKRSYNNHSDGWGRSYNPREGWGMVIHKGVQCDGCGVHPITGTRFKSKVKEDYDLCSICFAEMGTEAEYIIMNHPTSYQNPASFFDSMQSLVRSPTLPAADHSKFDSCFIQDVNILDGTIMTPSTLFTKIWRMRNNGAVSWPRGTRLLWIGGDKFSKTPSCDLKIPADGCPVYKEIDIAVDFTAPENPGRYISYWRMASPSGHTFGQRVWVLIQVDSLWKDPLSKNAHDFNLNLPPPVSSGIMDFQNENAFIDPIIEDEKFNKEMELVEPVVDTPKEDLGPNHPINETLLVAGAKPDSSSLEASSPVTYPAVDLSEVEPIAISTAPEYPDINVPSSMIGVGQGKDEVEQALLKDLNDMGFTHVDLNKEILRKNGYDLEQSINDLCSVTEWDPLTELQEMGFSNHELNKMLLKKNNGSIKRVVMDLIAGEE